MFITKRNMKMILLKVSFEHLNMFKDGMLDIDFYASDKVPSGDESVTLLEKPVYTQNVVAIAGINASGKTVGLTLLDLVLRIVEGRPIGVLQITRSLATVFTEDLPISALLWGDGRLYCYHGVLERADAGTGFELRFREEQLFSLRLKHVTKEVLSADFDELQKLGEAIVRRTELSNEDKRFLHENVSILSEYTDRAPRHLFYEATDMPLTIAEAFDGLDEVLKTFDPSIEHLEVEDDGRAFRLQTRNHAVPLVLSREGLEDILSAGTAKGLVVMQRAIEMLRIGGCLLLDEIEMHLNRQLVNVVIGLFAARTTNPRGATLVFTTHYPEILDVIHRKDNVYFFARSEGAQSEAVKYSTRVKRIENKKSEVFMSSFVRGTAPRFTEVAALKAYVETAVGSKDA